jgi:hypothetical protein
VNTRVSTSACADPLVFLAAVASVASVASVVLLRRGAVRCKLILAAALAPASEFLAQCFKVATDTPKRAANCAWVKPRWGRMQEA